MAVRNFPIFVFLKIGILKNFSYKIYTNMLLSSLFWHSSGRFCGTFFLTAPFVSFTGKNIHRCIILLIIKNLMGFEAIKLNRIPSFIKKIDFSKYVLVIDLSWYESKHFRLQMICTSLYESRRTNICIIEKCNSPRINLKIRYNFLGHLVYCWQNYKCFC